MWACVYFDLIIKNEFEDYFPNPRSNIHHKNKTYIFKKKSQYITIVYH